MRSDQDRPVRPPLKHIPKKKKIRFRQPWDTTPMRPSKEGTALHWAVDPWKEEEARSLLEKGRIDINAQDPDGQTALHILVAQDIPEATQLLLDFGADVNARDHNMSTPLHCAVYFKAKEVVKVLLEAGADIEAQDKNLETPLHSATKKNALIATTALLEAGAKVDPPDGATTTLIHFATCLRRKRILMMFLDRVQPATVSFKEPDGTTPLHIAAEQGQYVAVYMLIKKGADIDAQDNNGNTPLHLAVAEAKKRSVAVLRRMGAKSSIRNSVGLVPDENFLNKHEHRAGKSLVSRVCAVRLGELF